MVKVFLNAVFYSKGNIEKAYLVKNVLWKTKFQVTNISEISDLMYTIHKDQVNLLIIDCESIKLTEEFICIIQGGKFCAPDNIIFLDCENICKNFQINSASQFLVSSSKLDVFFNETCDKILFNTEKKSYGKFDTNCINRFLTQYLIKLGFLPKHVGFCYIKQCIEEAINRNGVLGALSTEIYPIVARRNGTTAVNIERNIRNSIECANKFTEFKDEELTNMLSKQKRISNRAFLSYLLDKVLISYTQLEQQIN